MLKLPVKALVELCRTALGEKGGQRIKLTQVTEKEEINRGTSEGPGWRNRQTQRT